MLATLRRSLPADQDRYGWEFKWDGVRAIAYVSGGEVRLVSRNDKDMAASYPELAVLAGRVGAPVVLDGEIVALRAGRPDFGALHPGCLDGVRMGSFTTSSWSCEAARAEQGLARHPHAVALDGTASGQTGSGPLRTRDGAELNRTKIVPYAYRHTCAQRHARQRRERHSQLRGAGPDPADPVSGRLGSLLAIGAKRGEEGSFTFKRGDTTILTHHGRPGSDITKEHGRATGQDVQIVRPSTPARRPRQQGTATMTPAGAIVGRATADSAFAGDGDVRGRLIGGTGDSGSRADAIMGTLEAGFRSRPPDMSSPAQSPGIGGGFPAQFADARRRARPRRGLDPPELQVRLPGLGPGILHPFPADDPVLQDCVDGVQPGSPDEPGRAAVVPGLNVNGLAVHPVHALPAFCPPQCSSGRTGQPDHLAGRCRMEEGRRHDR